MLCQSSVLSISSLNQFEELIHKEFKALPHQVLTVQRGDVIYHQGDKVDKIGFIIEGLMKCANYTNNGDEINPHYFYEGDIFPEYLLLAGEDEYIYTLVAEKRSKLILVDFEAFRNLIFTDIEWCQLMIAYMARRGLLAEKWKLCNCYVGLRSRIAYMLLHIYETYTDEWTAMKDNQRIIATKLQISRTAYNQEMIKLEKEKVIQRVKGKIKLLDRRKLEAYL